MKFNSISKRAGAFLLLLIMGQNIIMPTCVYALSGGPLQSEFSSFESVGSTDMVNLFTGDFTYSVPVLNVPGIDGGFSMPLSYHAGTGPEEEASWVGLGWNINPGAITRNIINKPDDYSGELINYSFTDPGSSGYSYVIPFIIGSYSYDSDRGEGGTIGYGAWLSIGLGTQSGEFTILAVSKKGVDPVGVISIAADIFTYGTSSIALNGLGKALSVGLTAYSVANMVQATVDANKSYSINDYQMIRGGNPFYHWYKYYMAKTIDQYFYGSLYLGNTDNIDYGTNASVLITKANNTNIPSQGYNYKDWVIGDVSTTTNGQISPSQINYDNFNVQGEGVSGSIQPYRLDIGSLNFKLFDNPNRTKLALMPFTSPDNYKVQFRYPSEAANSYTNPIGTGYGSTPVSIDDPNQFGFQIITDESSYCYYKQKDEVLYASIPSTPEVTNKRVVTGKFINWFSNAEITAGTAATNGFINYKTGDTRSGLPVKGIGGYSITRPDGFTYHYALPVYNREQLISTSPVSGNTGVTSVIIDNNRYASTWLLTAITGPDFVDRGTLAGVIDQDDWGYWVKFDYGKFASNFGWSNPYDFNTQMIAGETNQLYSVANGKKETYYLDKITTKTHTALFFKNLRVDGKGTHAAYFVPNGPSPVDDTFTYGTPPSSSLKLDDIVVLRNEDYNTLLTAPYNLRFDLNSTLSENTIKNGDTFKNVIDVNDISENSNAAGINNFISQNQIRKIHFNYDYILCPKTLNSFNIDWPTITYNGAHVYTDNARAKLTLLSVSSLGRNNSKLAPDYQFSYGAANPDYGMFSWDAWGMYKPNGTNTTDGHRASVNGSEWSLRKIITPLGGEINIDYERDTYSSISGKTADIVAFATYNTTAKTITVNSDYAPLTPFAANGSIRLQTAVYDKYPGQSNPQLLNVLADFTITQVSGNVLTISQNMDNSFQIGARHEPGYPQDVIRTYATPGQGRILNTNNVGLQHYGGDIRVSKISTKDENGIENATEYYYSQDGSKYGLTSGVCAVEPVLAYTGSPRYDFYDFYDYPSMPIVYGKVTVLNTSNKKAAGDFVQKESYDFVTPSYSQITFQTDPPFHNTARSLALNFKYKIHTAAIGSLTAQRRYSNSGQLLSETTLQYSDGITPALAGNIGTYAQSTFYCDKLTGFIGVSDFLYRTTKVHYPNILTSITQKTNTQTITTTNKVWDYLTGAVLEKETTTSLGEKLLSVSKPAYKAAAAYASMSSKAYNINNKNMMVQEAQTYLYNVKADGTKQLVESQAQTWNNNWTYREYDPALNIYKDVLRNNEIWRNENSYVWKSLLNGESGTVATSDFADFNWLNPTGSDARWQKTGAIKYYDHYSSPLSVVDINNNFSSAKLGYNSNQIIAGANNSSYAEIAYSGAEEGSPVSDQSWFPGELTGNGANKRSTSFAHTGSYSCKVPSGGFGFSYGVPVVTDPNLNFGAVRGRTYRASVWVHKTNISSSTQPVLAIMSTNSQGQVVQYKAVSQQTTTTKRAGDWYLLYADITIPPSAASEVGVGAHVWNNNTGVDFYFDDFRFHPIDAPMQSYVYDNRGLLQATLDQENFATVFEYDNAGRIIATYREVENDGIRKVSEKKYNFARGN